MAVNEISGFLKFKDTNGDINLLLPITTKDNVDGLDELEENIGTLNEHAADADIHFTADERNKLKNIEADANKTVVDSTMSTSSENPVQNKVVKAYVDDALETAASGKANKEHTHDWESIENRPFGEVPGTDTVYWDGNREGLVKAEGYDRYMVSTATPTLADFENGASNTKLVSGTETTANLQLNYAIYEAGEGCIVVGNTIVALKDGATLDDEVYPKKGTYFTWIGNDSYTTRLTINGYTGFLVNKKLDPKWLPDHSHNLGPTPIVTSGDGAEYTVTIDGVTELYNGLQFIMLPHTNSTTTSVKLNVNGLGAKMIRQRMGTNTSIGVAGATANWIVANKPITVTYNGSAWMAEIERPDATNIYGTVAVKSGGTGKTTVTAGNFLVGNGTEAMVEKTPAEVLNLINGAGVATASVGQTIIVEEVDANGKPTKWKSVDYQPRTHYKGKVELYNATLEGLTTDEAVIEGFSMQVGETYNITWNGVEYTCVCIEVPDTGGMCYIGNASAFELEDTGEPFVIVYGTEDGVNFFTLLVSLDGVDEATVVIKGTGYIPIPVQYVTNAFPYYVEITEYSSGTSGAPDTYVCTESVANLTEILNSGRMIVAKVAYYGIVGDGEMRHTVDYYANTVGHVLDSGEFIFATMHTNGNSMLVLSPQEDDTFVVSGGTDGIA